MAESIDQLMANGAGFSAPTPSGASSGASGGFDVADVWDSAYNLRLPDDEGVGKIPMPSQAKIDNFQRTIARLFIELDEAARKEREARGGDEDDTRTAEQKLADVEDAIKLKREVMGKFCDALSLVCSNNPTRKQLGKLNEPALMGFLGFVGGLLNPNV